MKLKRMITGLVPLVMVGMVATIVPSLASASSSAVVTWAKTVVVPTEEAVTTTVDQYDQNVSAFQGIGSPGQGEGEALCSWLEFTAGTADPQAPEPDLQAIWTHDLIRVHSNAEECLQFGEIGEPVDLSSLPAAFNGLNRVLQIEYGVDIGEMLATPPKAKRAPSVPQTPSVLSVDAAPSSLGSHGGSVIVAAKLRNATSCQLRLLSRQSFPVTYASNVRPCAARFSAHVTIGANPSEVARTVAFALVVRNGYRNSSAVFYVVLAARKRSVSAVTTTTTTVTRTTTTAVKPEAPVLRSVEATPSTLGPSGGTVTVAAGVTGAQSCQLRLLSTQSVRVIYANNERPCGSAFSAHIEVGSNPTALRRVIAFALVARNKGVEASRRFYISVQGAFPADVLLARASAATISPNGGTISVVALVAHATTCQLRLAESQSIRVVFSQGSRPCTSGNFETTVEIGANPGRSSQTLGFELLARNSTSQSVGKFYVTVSGPYRPEVVYISASPGTLGPDGGLVTVNAAVTQAVSCTLHVTSAKSVRVSYSAAATRCDGGSFEAKVSVGTNSSYAARSLTFTVVATNNTSSSSGSTEVNVNGEVFTPTIAISGASLSVPESGGKLTLDESIVALKGSVCTADLRDQTSGEDWPNSINCSTGSYQDDLTLVAVNTPQTYLLTFTVSGPNETTVSKSVTITQSGQTTNPTTTMTTSTATTTTPNATTTTGETTTNTTTTTAASGPSATCEATYTADNEDIGLLGGSSGGEVEVQSPGPGNIWGWMVRWTLSGGQTLAGENFAEVTQKGTEFTAVNPPNGGYISSGGSAGFEVTFNGSPVSAAQLTCTVTATQG